MLRKQEQPCDEDLSTALWFTEETLPYDLKLQLSSSENT